MSGFKLAISLAACMFVASTGMLIAADTAAPAAPAAPAVTEVTLKGTLECAKCALKEADKCQNVLVVKDGDKSTEYLVMGEVSTKYHKNVCTAPKDGVSVTGVVTEKDGKKVITATKIEA